MGNALNKCPRLPEPELGEGLAVVTLAMGCFWTPDKEWHGTPGVVDVVVGYAGGAEADPTYKDIKDHTEAVRIVYKTKTYSFADVVEIFCNRHTPYMPTIAGRQYRSVVWVSTDEERAAAQAVLDARLQRGWSAASNVAVEDVGAFYRAEEYHQRYLEKSRKTWGAMY